MKKGGSRFTMQLITRFGTIITYNKYTGIALILLILASCERENLYKKQDKDQKSVKNKIQDMIPGQGNNRFSSPPMAHKINHPPVPDQVTFGGDTVPLHKQHVREALEYELIVNTFRHSRTMAILKRISRWRPMIESVLHENDIPEDFIYLAVAESEFKNDARSYAGATGMWQFMKSTAMQYNLEMNFYVDMRRDPKASTKAACKYFNWAYAKFQDWFLVMASFNRGVRGMRNKLSEQRVDSFFDLHLNNQTSRYVYRIIAFKLILENPEMYGYYLKPEFKFEPYAFKTVEVNNTINLVDFAKKHNTTYKKLRILNPWFNNTSSYKLRATWGKSYDIRVPQKTEKTPDKRVNSDKQTGPGCNYVNHYYNGP